MALQITHLELAEANALVALLHRHHKPCQGHRFSIGAIDLGSGALVGAAIVGRPVARKTDQRKVVEVTRLVTDGTKNACSFLYSAAARCGRELGYEKIQTFILASETGASLIAAGWFNEGEAGGLAWNGEGKTNTHPAEMKQRWSKSLRGADNGARFSTPVMEAPPVIGLR